MISKILKLKNIGLLLDATQTGAVSLGQVTAIYAENGRGKSTLAAVLRACKLGDSGRLNARKTIDRTSNPEVQLLLSTGNYIEFKANAWTATLPDIMVFDSEFVEQNVYSGFEVRADQRQSLLEFALGDQTVQLKQRIDQLTQDIDAQTRKRTSAEKALTGFTPPYNIAQFIALQPVPDAQQQIDALQKRIEATKNTQALMVRKDPTNIATIQFNPTSLFAVLRTRIEEVEKAAERLVKTHLAKHTYQDIEDWASRGQQYLKEKECPFCGQDIHSLDLIEAYRSYFNKAYVDLKQQVATLKSQIEMDLAESKIEAIGSAVLTNTARIDAWRDQIGIAAPALDCVMLSSTLKQVRERVLYLIGVKQSAPLETVGSQSDIDLIAEAFTEMTQVIDAYNIAVQAVTVQIDKFREKLSVIRATDSLVEIRKLEAAQKRVLPEVTAAVAEYQAAEAERKRLDAEKTNARRQLDALMHSTLQQYQTTINNLLNMFGAEFSIEQLKPTYLGGGEPRSEYGLCIRNKSVRLGSRVDIVTDHSFATTLSEADKRTLAFAFFVARLKDDLNHEKKIVVLDDPISSFDLNRRSQSIRLIANLAKACRQLLVLSHDAYFIREFQEHLGNQKSESIATCVLTMKRVENGYSAFASCDIKEICSSDYYRHHRLIADYVDGKSTANNRDVAKAIRPFLEGYYHRRFPGRVSRGLMFGKIIEFITLAPAGDPLAHLKPMLKEISEINEYARQFHHDTETVRVVDGELLSFARRALRLVYENG